MRLCFRLVTTLILLQSLSLHAQKVGVNINIPVFEMDIRSLDISEGSSLNVGNQDNSHFVRLFSGRPVFPVSILYWKEGTPLILGTDQSFLTELMRITSSGSVGIGMPDPQSKLDILGGQWNLAATEGDLRLGNDSYRLVAGTAIDGGGAGISRIYAKGGQATLILGSDNTDVMTIDSANRVGIGTTIPVNRLDVRSDGVLNNTTTVLALISDISNRPVLQFSEFATGVSGSGMSIEYDGSDAANPIHFRDVAGQRRFTFTGTGLMGVGVTSPNEMLEVGGTGRLFIGNGAGATRKGLLIAAVNGGNFVRIHPYNYSSASNMDLYIPTNVTIGRETGASGYMLSVNGKVIAEEVRIQLDGDWPDFVFAEDYTLPDLEELERSIHKHKHLPGIPSAKTILEEGLLVGDMQSKLLEKIEELTLYVIQQHKEIARLSREVEMLKTQK